jgi:hypothetical protein
VRQHNEAKESIRLPAKPAWLLHIPEIVAHLEALEVPVVDRAIVEKLFGLRRRQAIALLHRFGGYQAGRTFLLDRRLLVEELRRVSHGEDFDSETRRQQRLGDAVDECRRNQAASQVRIPIRPEFARKVADLPAGICLEAGHLQVEFFGAEDLLAKLYELSQAAARDFDRFRRVAEPVDRSA